MEVFNSIPVDLEPDKVLKSMNMRGGNRRIEEMVQKLVEVARSVAKPKVVYKVSCVDDKDGGTVVIDGVRFTSRVLGINLSQVERIFPYIATCGMELEEITVPPSDVMKSFCFDAIKTMVVRLASAFLRNHLVGYYALGSVSCMSPGSLESWPLTQQKELFSLFGDAEELIGVKLTKNFVMVPLKSVSGVYFPTEITFESCQLCPREKCIGRRVPYDPELAKKYREAPV
ncbi:vitamin B12 dependent-methionine synthase activation domain-containing protein [Chloroflexota bacterium]